MKQKIKITSRQVKKIVLLVLLVAVVGLLTYVTIDSFGSGRVLSNSTAPNPISVSGEYKEYLDEFGGQSPAGYEFNVDETKNKAIKAVFNETKTADANEAHALKAKTDEIKNSIALNGETGIVSSASSKEFVYSAKNGSVVYDVTVSVAGYYNIILNYIALDEIEATPWEDSGGADIERAVYVNGVIPFDDVRNVSFTRVWGDDGEPLEDLSGNQIKPSQTEILTSRYGYVKDTIGYVTEPYLIYFEAGVNEIRLESIKENMGIYDVFVATKESYDSYEKYKNDHSSAKKITDALVKVEGEDASTRSSSTIYAVNDKTSAYTTTSDGAKASPVKLILNTIGGSKWTSTGSWISWEIEVPETGIYQISLRSKQNISRGLFSTRKLYIDNAVPFAEAQNCKFTYNSNYSIVTLGTKDEAFGFYLEAGKHTLTFECTLGDYASEISKIQDVIDDLNLAYREIIKRTGISPDPYIDYFAKSEGQAFIKNLRENVFPNAVNALREVSDNITKISGEKSSEATALETMAIQLEQFVANYRKIQKSLSDFSTNISSLGTWILNVSEQALTVDYLLVHGSEAKLPKANPNIFVSSWFGIRGFVGSFTFDYESVGLTEGNEEWEDVEVWLLTSASTGREQGNAISSMIYEAQNEAAQSGNEDHLLYGLNIKLKVVSAGVLLTATLADRGPDVAINVDNGLPVNYALRGAIQDLTIFDDFEEVTKQFMSSAITPYRFTDEYGHYGCYALPNTQSFLVMFYRTDMFEENNWTIPTTWEDVILLIPELQIMNFQFYLPLNQVGATSVVNQIFASYLYQTTEDPASAFYRTIDYKDADGRPKQYVESNFDSEESMKAFEFWCSFYSDYSFPLSASFVNRFRSGETPIGISSYDIYNTLAVSAPEIRGKWAFALLPGVEEVDENGNKYIDNMGAASGTAVVIMKDKNYPVYDPTDPAERVKAAEHYDACWRFTKWFVSTDTQVGYAREVESILGAAARLNTANVEAFKRLAWTQDEINVLVDQWENTIGVPEVPGGYYTGRNLENAFRYVVNNNENPRQTLSDYIRTINSEIDRKRNEFGLGTSTEYQKLYGKED